MARGGIKVALALIALVTAACGTAIEVTAPALAPSTDPTSTAQSLPTATPRPAREAVAPDVDDTLGTSSSVRYPIEVGGRINSLLPYDAIRPVYDPEFVAGDEALVLDASDLVIGLSFNGDTRAYPVRTLRSREMVNDVVGGIPVLVTW